MNNNIYGLLLIGLWSQIVFATSLLKTSLLHNLVINATTIQTYMDDLRQQEKEVTLLFKSDNSCTEQWCRKMPGVVGYYYPRSDRLQRLEITTESYEVSTDSDIEELEQGDIIHCRHGKFLIMPKLEERVVQFLRYR